MKNEITVKKDGKLKGYVYAQGKCWIAQPVNSYYSQSFLSVGDAVEALYNYSE